MSEESLLEELTARFLPAFEQSLDRLAAMRARNAVQSGDEWWEATLKRSFDVNPAFAERLKTRKEEMLEQRRTMNSAMAAVNAEALAKRRAEEVLPALLKVRRLRRAKGPTTDNQFHAACMAADLAKIASLRKRIKKAAAEATDPRRKRVLSMLAGNVQIDLKSLRGLARPDVTEERLEDTAQGIAARFQAMTEALTEGTE